MGIDSKASAAGRRNPEQFDTRDLNEAAA